MACDTSEALPFERREVIRVNPGRPGADEVPVSSLSRALPGVVKFSNAGSLEKRPGDSACPGRGTASLDSASSEGGVNSCPLYLELAKIFHVTSLARRPFHEICAEMFGCSASTLQLGIHLGQLLCSHPRDGDFVKTWIVSTFQKEKLNAPTRRDMLPFMFSPPMGAALKLIAMFPVSVGGVVQVEFAALKQLGRQQKRKLVHEGALQLWRWLIVAVLNGEYMDWSGSAFIPSSPSLGQQAALEMIGGLVKRFLGNPMEEFTTANFGELLKAKSIDYHGEEVSYALPLQLEELLPGLPDAAVGGSLDAVNVADDEVRLWLEDSERCLKPRNLWPEKVPTAKINATRDEWNRVVAELYRRNLLTTIDEKEIFAVNGKLVLNGAFAVLKSGAPGPNQVKVTRLIMNMTPSNAYQMCMKGDLQTLSASSNWAGLVLPPQHVVLWSSDDQKGAFYAWRVPRSWHRMMAFRWRVPGELVGKPKGTQAYVCSAVIPMGWLSAVSLFQHLHRRLGMMDYPLGAGFESQQEWRRDRPVPQPSKQPVVSWVQYYLDDFDAPEIVPESEYKNLEGSMSETQTRQRAAYQRQGVAISEKKAQKREPFVTRMGAEIDGIEGILGAPRAKKLEVLRFSLWFLGQKWPKQKGLLMILGRMVRCFEFQRPLMSVLRECWPKINVHVRCPVSAGAVRSLIRGCVMMPLAVAQLRVPVTGLVSASDASEQGGGLCVSESLTDEGLRMLEALQDEAYEKDRCFPFQSAGAMVTADKQGPRVFVLSLFDGVAAVMQSLSRLRCKVVGFAASEIDKDCKRLVRKRWPGVIELGKVECIDEKVINSLVVSLGFEIDLFLISAGSPCQDLTVLLAGRTGLQGQRSKLFFEIPRIRDLCVARFPGKVACMVENVFSMTPEARAQFSQVLKVEPIMIEAAQLSWVKRPRLYWCSWEVKPQGAEQLSSKAGYQQWDFPDYRPDRNHWQEPGWQKVGEGALPTFTRALPRDKPPLRPAGLETASAEAQERWTKDRFRFQVYQYETNNLLWHENNWRLPSLVERERLMGFDEGYISSCLPSKLGADQRFNLGCCMIGNTFHVHAVTMLLHSLLGTVDPFTPPRNLSEMLTCCQIAPSGWVDKPQFTKDPTPDSCAPQLVHEIMRQGDRAGSDIRLDVGVPFRFKAFPRAGLRTSLFQWRVIHGYRWRHPAHINALELQAVVNSLNWRLRKLSNHRKRVLHLIDSQVVACVIAKGRTSSFRLRKALQKLNSLLLTSGIKLAVAYCHTSDNPSDIPSRWAERPTSKSGNKKGERSTFGKRWSHNSCLRDISLSWSTSYSSLLTVTSGCPIWMS